MDIDDQELAFNEKLLLTNIGVLAEMYKSKCGMNILVLCFICRYVSSTLNGKISISI